MDVPLHGGYVKMDLHLRKLRNNFGENVRKDIKYGISLGKVIWGPYLNLYIYRHFFSRMLPTGMNKAP